MSSLSSEKVLEIDRRHIWHPYSRANSSLDAYPVRSARGVEITLADGRVLIDGMASWWSAIHGYNHPVLNQAVFAQLESMSHIMFGGLTHEPGARLAQRLVELTPDGLDRVFFCDSGSVGVEVALKMALQYWISRGQPAKNKILALRGGYHGDTFGAMSVTDPENGMHRLFSSILMQQLFTEAPRCNFTEDWDDCYISDLERTLDQHSSQIAALILEPVVQGAGGMRFYSPTYLQRARKLCNDHDVLLIADEIATGFGRSGRLFGCDHAGISPDIMCLGKALTGGYMTFAATLCTDTVANGISSGEPGAFMHGPTFMGNPLAAAVSLANIELLLSYDWAARIDSIERQLGEHLAPLRDLAHVADVRVLGAIGVVELNEEADLQVLQPMLVEEGIWLRPFRKLVYTMPPFVISSDQLTILCKAACQVLEKLKFKR